MVGLRLSRIYKQLVEFPLETNVQDDQTGQSIGKNNLRLGKLYLLFGRSNKSRIPVDEDRWSLEDDPNINGVYSFPNRTFPTIPPTCNAETRHTKE